MASIANAIANNGSLLLKWRKEYDLLYQYKNKFPFNNLTFENPLSAFGFVFGRTSLLVCVLGVWPPYQEVPLNIVC